MSDIYIGLDIGGTKFLVAAADENGTILRRARAATTTTLEADLASLHAMIAEVAQGDTIRGMGAAIGGPLDWQTGVVSPLHQPAWRDVPLKDLMQARYACPFWVDVDTNIAALGEYYATPLPRPRHLLYLTLSTGMGGGYIVDGTLYRGMDGAHPEAAHQAVPVSLRDTSNVRCECGAPDCLEALVSGNGIRRIYGKPAEELNPQEWEEVAWHLGQGLRNLAALYAPDEIRIGGGVAVGGGESFIARAVEVMRSRLFIVPAPLVRLSTLGYDTALHGTLAVARFGLHA